ncbi:hypothetical protein AURDEDRAFT_186421 [Auricularia subglabra TFB-10046 SS5]|nr:hypothetical protein AURDEDRAFT_186421 [Auricularia subglabra TFB-10046 SS5]
MAQGNSKKRAQGSGIKLRLPARPASIEERVAARKTEMIIARQARLEEIKDTHDEMVRELFHLEKFVSLVNYDPKAAKDDNSQVFLDFRARYDLLAKSNPTAATRKTRSAAIERRESLSALITTPFQTPTPTPSRKPANANKPSPSPLVMKIKKPPAPIPPSPSPAPTERDDVESEDDEGVAPVKQSPARSLKLVINKGKAKHNAPEKDAGADPLVVANAARSSPMENPTPAKRGPGRPPRHSIATDAPRRSSSRLAPSTSDVGEPPPVVDNVDVERPSKRARRATFAVPEPPAPKDTPSRKRKRSPSPTAPRESPSRKRKRTPSPPPRAPTPESPFKHIKRVRLIQRIPYSHPAQVPPLPKHGRSLRALSESYIDLGDDGPPPGQTLEQWERDEIALRRKIDDFRRAGRLPPDMRGRALDAPDDPDVGGPWRAVVEEVEARGGVSMLRHRLADAQAGANRVAKLIAAHFAKLLGTDDQRRRLEERRLRKLAKDTIRDVTNEWRKAVFHIREKKNARMLEEEARRGKMHLDEILAQSGSRLEAQAEDLVHRSRSASIAASFHGQDEDMASEDEDDSDEEEDDDDDQSSSTDSSTRQSTEADGDARDQDDVDLSFLVGDTSLPDDAGDDEDENEDEELALVEDHISFEDFDDSEDEEETRSRTREPTPDDHSTTPDSSPAPATPPHPPGDVGPYSRDASEAVDLDIPLTEVTTAHAAEDAAPPTRDPAEDHLAIREASPAVTPAHPSEDALPWPDDAMPTSPPQVEDLAPSSETLEVVARATTPGTPPALTMNPMDMLLPVAPKPHDPAPSSHARDVQMVDSAVPTESTVPTTEHSRATSVSFTSEHVPPVESGKETDLNVLREASSQPSVSITETQTPSRLEPVAEEVEDSDDEDVPEYLRDFAVAPVDWDPNSKVTAPLLLRGNLRPYQQSGLEWLASLHTQNLNGILADEMGLGKTIQTIALLAHLACDRGIWGPHLVIVPTSVLLNWEMEFKKFLPGFKILAYHGSTERRRKLRQGWTNPYAFNVCVTSYTLASRDALLFKRKAWYYMVLDEAHMIKNFKSQRWNTLLGYRSRRRLLLTGTPLQNNLTELWSLLQFLMSGSNFANLKEFGDWFANPLEKAIEQGTVMDQETKDRVHKLHTVLRPYLLRRLKADVERELPQKYEHLVLCKLSKRQRLLYDEFMERTHTRAALESGHYQKIANVLMQLRKVCNHPDLFEVRPIVSPFVMTRSALADFEITELLVRRRWLAEEDRSEQLDLDLLGLRFVSQDALQQSVVVARSRVELDASELLYDSDDEELGPEPPYDTRTISGFRAHEAWRKRSEYIAARAQLAYVNGLKCAPVPVLGSELLHAVRLPPRLWPLEYMDDEQTRRAQMTTNFIAPAMVRSLAQRAEECAPLVQRFTCAIPPAIAHDINRFVLGRTVVADPAFDAPLHAASSCRAIGFPEPFLLQYDCGKLQELHTLLRERHDGGHRVLIFTQMTRVLDILEAFLNLHGWRYLRLDGATKIEDRQYITERFNSDAKVFAFIASSRSGGVGINLTGADTVIFYDSDFNPQMDKQCEDRAHRIGQIRDVHIYRFISAYTVEEAMLRKANQKRALDDLVIQQGGFDWRRVLFTNEEELDGALEREEEDADARARAVAMQEEMWRVGEDEEDFGDKAEKAPKVGGVVADAAPGEGGAEEGEGGQAKLVGQQDEEEEEGGAVTDYMLATVEREWEWFSTWRV